MSLNSLNVRAVVACRKPGIGWKTFFLHWATKGSGIKPSLHFLLLPLIAEGVPQLTLLLEELKGN